MGSQTNFVELAETKTLLKYKPALPNCKAVPNRSGQRIQALLSGVALLGLVIGGGSADAADFTVDTPTNAVNGGGGNPGNLGNGDTLTITDTGSIIRNGNAVVGTNDDNTIINNGTITTGGFNNDGIRVDDRNTISNTGAITTSGAVSQGITGDDENSIVNSGTIETSGVGSQGIRGGELNNVTNSGSIATTGGVGFGSIAHGIQVGDGSTVTNTGIITTDSFLADAIRANDDTIISNTGEIRTAGTFGDGIQADDRNIITNSGSIFGSAFDGGGIEVDDNNTIRNTGMITTEGNEGHGIFADVGNTISNAGSIVTNGEDANGVLAGNLNTVSNTGIINTSGENASGIEVDDDNVVRNFGTINTTGENGDGIDVNDDNTVSNSGFIRTSGDISDGIEADDRNFINNSGVVFTTGNGAEAIRVDDNNVITNSGKVVSAQDDAFELDNNNTLNLLAPSFVGGAFNLGTNTSLNIVTGPSHSVLWDFDPAQLAGGAPASLSGSVPWFYNTTTGQFATFDPTGLVASVENLIETTALISGTMSRRLDAGQLSLNGVTRGVGQASEGADAELDAGAFDKSGVWAQVMASRSSFDGGASTLDRETTLAGVAIGYDTNLDARTRIGVMGGYLNSQSEADSRFAHAFDNEKSGWFAAGYGRKSFGSLFVDVGLSAGISTDNETMRFVNDNLAPLGVSYAMGNSDSFWVSPEITIGSQIATSSKWTFSPTAKLRYAAEWFDGYTETGPSADANATVADRMIAFGEARLELAASRNVQFGGAMSALFTARGGALGRMSLGDDASTVTLLGITQDVGHEYADDFAVFGGLEASIAMTNALSLDLSSSATYGNEMTSVEGAAAVKVSF